MNRRLVLEKLSSIGSGSGTTDAYTPLIDELRTVAEQATNLILEEASKV